MPFLSTKGAASAQGFGLFLSLGSINWIGLLGATGALNRANSVAIDASGNAYMVGRYGSSPELQLAKYNKFGVIQWQRNLVATNASAGTGVVLDGSGDVIVCGSSNTTGATIWQLAKYNSSGVIQWQKSLNTGQAQGITVDSSNNIYATGVPGNYLVTVGYDSSGTVQWQRRLGAGFLTEASYSIASDSSGNLYIAGQSDASGTTDTQLAKYNSSGVIQWQRRLSDSIGYGIATDSSSNIYIVGSDMSAGGIQISKYNSSGTIQWQRRLYGPSTQQGNGVIVDSSSNVYITGLGYSSGDTLQLAKYNSSGTIQWQRTLNGTGFTEGGWGIAVDAAGNFCTVGVANQQLLIAKLPQDGTKTGSYTVGSITLSYSASSLTDTSTSHTDASTSRPEAASSYTAATTTLTDSSTTLTSSVTPV